MTIYFNENKEAFGCEIENPLATIDDATWANYATTDKWDIIDGEFIDISDTPEYEAEQAQKREVEFENTFFEIPIIENVFAGGWYRKTPKGYSSAVESLNTAFNAVSLMGKLPVDTLTFYIAPDFTDAEQCTEEWLVENAFKNEEMTTAQFAQFYSTFLQAWNASEH